MTRCLNGGSKRILLVAHGGVIRAVLESLLDLKPAHVVPVGPARLTVLKHVRVDDKDEFRLELFNFRPSGPVFEGAAGSGLGLSIAEWIAEKDGGSASMSSTRGERTELRIELPLQDRREQ